VKHSELRSTLSVARAAGLSIVFAGAVGCTAELPPATRTSPPAEHPRQKPASEAHAGSAITKPTEVPQPSQAPSDLPAPSTESAEAALDPLGLALEEVSAVELVGCVSFTSPGELWAGLSPEEADSVSPECAALKRQLDPQPEASAQSEDLATDDPLPGVHVCVKDSSGAAWAVQVRASRAPEGTYAGTWRLVRAARGTALAFSPAHSYRGLSSNTDGTNLPPECLGSYDFDGDGRPEAIVVSREGINNAAREKRIYLWASDGSRSLRPYPGASRFAAFGITDFDGDGRPDLAVNPYAHSRREPVFFGGWYPHHSNISWGLVAGSTPDGGFSVDGATSRLAALRMCPQAPASSLPASTSTWAAHLHCAKLWGQSASSLKALLESACADPKDAEVENACNHGEGFFKAVLARKLPFTLP
jgi:hypothetical protein